MKKIIVITALLSCIQAYAGQNTLSHAISSNLNNGAPISSKPAMIYGGKDFHRSVMAIANETYGLNQETFTA
jgi:hypothetical protein